MIEFVCPQCGSTKLIETMKDVVVTSECSITDNGVEYGEQTNEDGEVAGYQCENGHEVVGETGGRVTTQEELMEILGPPVLSHDDVVELIADRLRQLSSDELVMEYERAFPAPILKYLGDSLYVVEEREPDAADQRN